MPRIIGVIAAVALLGAAVACGRSRVASLGTPTMPDPGGCYVVVYERSEFMGPREYINGPRQYATLRDLPFRANWRRRIRSVQVGPMASVTMWGRERFEGVARRFPSNTRQTTLDALSGQVESLDVQCERR